MHVRVRMYVKMCIKIVFSILSLCITHHFLFLCIFLFILYLFFIQYYLFAESRDIYVSIG